MNFLNRREFLEGSAALAAAAAAGSLTESALAADVKAAAKKGQANDQLRVACIGVRGQGQSHVKGYAGRNNCVVSIICDADAGVIGPAMKAAESGQKFLPKYEQDIRKVVTSKDIDAVSIATPNHWHALAAIWALQNGKHVYVEKPVSHNVSEGRRMVEAARKHKLICQTGTQSRSMAGMRDAIAFIHKGGIGKVTLARGLCYKRRKSIGKVTGPQTPPKSCDYDLWTGPAPLKALMRKSLHYDWHWVWDTGNGDLGNQGIHEMDKARWGLNKTGLPKSVVSVGGRFGYVDDGETANTQIIVFDYGDAELIFEVRGLETGSPYPFQTKEEAAKTGNSVGNIWYGSKGIVVCPNYGGGIAYDLDGKILKKFGGGGDHFGNFVKAVRSGKSSDLNADIEEGHLSSALCHLGNISYRLGELTPFNKETKAFGDDKKAYEIFAATQEHLKENMVPLAETMYRVGPKLTIDPSTESFVGNKDADKLLTREYRKGFEVPEQGKV